MLLLSLRVDRMSSRRPTSLMPITSLIYAALVSHVQRVSVGSLHAPGGIAGCGHPLLVIEFDRRVTGQHESRRRHRRRLSVRARAVAAMAPCADARCIVPALPHERPAARRPLCRTCPLEIVVTTTLSSSSSSSVNIIIIIINALSLPTAACTSHGGRTTASALVAFRIALPCVHVFTFSVVLIIIIVVVLINSTLPAVPEQRSTCSARSHRP
jgi:hypothetical protein